MGFRRGAWGIVPALAVLVMASSPTAQAAPGDLDLTYGDGGKVTTAVGRFSPDSAESIDHQSNGQAIVLTETGTSGNSQLAVMRLTPGGDFDSSFGGGDGFVTIDPTNAYDHPAGVVVRPDDSILIAGTTGNALRMFVASLDPDGSPDTSFGSNGIATVTTPAQALDLMLDHAGRPVVAGFSNLGTSYNNDFAVARFTPEGQPDTSFGGDGFVSTDIDNGGGAGQSDKAFAIDELPDGDLIVGGHSDARPAPYDHGELAKYNPDGSLDVTFGHSGVLNLPQSVPEGNGIADVVADPIGRIDVLAASGAPGTLNVLRVLPTGNLDPTWSGDGIAQTRLGANNTDFYPRSGLLRDDGKLMVAGSYTEGAAVDGVEPTGTVMALFDQSGELAPGFAQGGYFRDLDGRVPRQLDIDPAGNLLTAETTLGRLAGQGTGGLGTYVTRRLPSGALDPSFGDGGHAVNPVLTLSHDHAFVAARQPDGKVVIAGAGTDNGSGPILTRLNHDGSVDETFGDDGRVLVSLNKDTLDFTAKDIAIRPDGRILVAGDPFGDGDGYAVASFNPDGSRDTSFGTNGYAKVNIGRTFRGWSSSSSDAVWGIVLQPDGSVVIAGDSEASTVIIRLKPDGSIDRTFAGTGFYSGPFGTRGGIVADPFGRIVTWSYGGSVFRFTPDGVRDPTFGPPDGQYLNVGSFADLVPEPDGSLAGVGGTSDEHYLIHLTPFGQLDPGFGTGGKVVIPDGEQILRQPDGAYLVGFTPSQGYSTNPQLNFELRRYLPDGTTDPFFQPQSIDFRGAFDELKGMLFDNPNRVLLFGDSMSPEGYPRFAVSAHELGDIAGSTPPPDTYFAADSPAVVTTATPSFTFTSNVPDASFECKVDDDDDFEPCSGPGSTHRTDLLPDGPHQIEVRAIDLSGQVDPTPAVHAFAIHRMPDTTITQKPADLSNDPTPTFEFTSDVSGTTFECRLDGAGADAWAECTSPDTLPAVSDGSHVFEVRAKNPGGTDPSPVQDSFTVDTTPPTLSITGTPPNLASTPTPLFQFSAESGATVSCSVDSGTPQWTNCSQADRHESPPQSDGDHTFRVRAIDAAGNETIRTHDFTVDTTPPDTFFDAAPSGPTQNDSPEFSFHSNDPTARFECSVNLNTRYRCTSPASLPGLRDGSYTFTVIAIDPATNEDLTPVQTAFTVDQVAPDTRLTSGPPSSGQSKDVAFAFEAVDGDDATRFECRLDGAAFDHCASPYETTTPVGPHTFEVRAIDGAGNADASPAAEAFTVDAPDSPPVDPPPPTGDDGKAPNTVILSSPKRKMKRGRRAVSFTFSSDAAPVTYECSFDDGAWSSCQSPARLKGLERGRHEFRVRAVDSSGRQDQTPATFAFRVRGR